jgi:hypothetical protein
LDAIGDHLGGFRRVVGGEQDGEPVVSEPFEGFSGSIHRDISHVEASIEVEHDIAGRARRR